MTEMNDSNKEETFEKVFNYKFHNVELRTRAMTSKSWLNENDSEKLKKYPAYTGLATLGDAVISLCIVHYYFSLDMKRGDITIEKSEKVRRTKHTKIAHEIQLMNFMNLGKGEAKQEAWINGSAPGEFLESVLGAIYLDEMSEGGNGIIVCSKVLKHLGQMEKINDYN